MVASLALASAAEGSTQAPSNRVYIVSTRAPKEPLSGGMAPAVREASMNYGEVIWYALGNVEDRSKMAKDFVKENRPFTEQPTFDNTISRIDYVTANRFNVRQLMLNKSDWTSHYDVFCNSWIWPICHNLAEHAKDKLDDFDIQGNEFVNEAIARDMAEQIRADGDTSSPIMIQDYHHFKLAKYLRHHGVTNPIIFFNHIPMPTMETFHNMGENERRVFKEMMTDLLACDSVQFQTEETARRYLKIIGQKKPPMIPAYQSVVYDDLSDPMHPRTVRIGHAPISINTAKIIETAASNEPLKAEHSRYLESQMQAPFILLNFERCDYSKGILERAQAFEKLMQVRPNLRGKVQLVLQAEPTRTDVPEYRKYAEDVGKIVERLNARPELMVGNIPPVIFLNAQIPHDDLLRIMSHSAPGQRRIGTVTPFEDGMNLTAKEFAAAQNLKDPNPLILSTGAGAAAELDGYGHGAVTYKPAETGDPMPLVRAMIQAIDMNQSEAIRRAEVMMQKVKANTIQDWGAYFENETRMIQDARAVGVRLGGLPLHTPSLDLRG